MNKYLNAVLMAILVIPTIVYIDSRVEAIKKTETEYHRIKKTLTLLTDNNLIFPKDVTRGSCNNIKPGDIIFYHQSSVKEYKIGIIIKCEGAFLIIIFVNSQKLVKDTIWIGENNQYYSYRIYGPSPYIWSVTGSFTLPIGSQ